MAAEDPAIAGVLAGQEYKMNQMLLQEAPVKLEREKLALKISQTDFDARQKMAAMLAKNQSQIPADMDPMTNARNTLLQMAQAAASSGMPEEASADFAKAAQIQSQQEKAAYDQWRTTEHKLKFADQLLTMAHDQASFDQMNAYARTELGVPSALEGQKYSPELIQRLRDSLATKRTAAQEAYTKAQEKNQEALTVSNRALADLRKAQTTLAEKRANAAGKAGADGLMPKARTISAVSALLQDESQDELTPVDARALALDIAADAERRMKEDGQSGPEAIHAAVEFAKTHGALAGRRPANVRPGTSPKKPMPLPKNPGDPKAFKDQMFYQTPAGVMWYSAEDERLYPPGRGPEDRDDDDGDDKDDE